MKISVLISISIALILSSTTINYTLASQLYNGETNSQIKIQPHNPPSPDDTLEFTRVYATASMLETEILKSTGLMVKISERYFIYYKYIEVVKRIAEGESIDPLIFIEQFLPASVFDIIDTYGFVPSSEYEELHKTISPPDHAKISSKVSDVIKRETKNDTIDKIKLIVSVRKILNKHLGKPPYYFSFQGRRNTPTGFAKAMNIDPQDFVKFMAVDNLPVNQKGALNTPANLKQDSDYYNITNKELLQITEYALDNEYTVCICYDPLKQQKDSAITKESPEIKESDSSFCYNVIGYFDDPNNQRWLMCKDPFAKGVEEGTLKGYRYLRTDFILTDINHIALHKYGAKPVLDKIIK